MHQPPSGTHTTTSRAAIGIVCLLCAWAIGTSRAAYAQAEGGAEVFIGQRVVGVTIEQEGRVVTDPVVSRLAGAIAGRPLAIAELREVIARLMSLGRFEDVQPHAEPAPEGVRIRYVLVPQHPVDRVELRGDLGLPEGDVRRLLTERFGAAPPRGRTQEVAEALRIAYRDRGFPEAAIAPSIEETHDPDRATMVLTIDAGRRAQIASVEVRSLDAEQGVLPVFDTIRAGQPYDAAAINRAIDRYVERMRGRGYYEARAIHTAAFDPEGARADVTIAVARGPLIVVEFAGDPLPSGERNRLVPVRSEGSADEDLLEDAELAIREYLFAQGYRDAEAEYTRTETPGQVTITFHVTRGPRYVVDAVRFAGFAALSEDDLQELLPFDPGDPFVQQTLDLGIAQIGAAYRGRGYVQAVAAPEVAVLPAGERSDETRHVEITVAIAEGPRTFVRSIAVEGAEAFGAAGLRELMTLGPGEPYSDLALRDDRDRIDLAYRNAGYDSAVIDIDVALADDETQADLTVRVDEGPQMIVDHIIVVGNRRTRTETIERELLLEPGGPVGYSALVESRARLITLGLFRRVQIDVLAHSTGPRRDVLVTVEEADVYSLGYGGGLEGGFRLRRGADGLGEERFELAPRGFFEIGRRNLWGKNRSINLFTRVSLRSRDSVLGEQPVIDPSEPAPLVDSAYGFNEYRVLLTYREPRILGTRADALVTGIAEQAIRTRFNFITREARAEVGWRLNPVYSVLGRYVVKSTELFGESFPEEDRPLIDRVFPQVRISKVAGSVLRDTRDDLLDPSSGTFMSIDADLAARAIGSEVGFIKGYFQAFAYRRLPFRRRIVLAAGARLGAARGFERTVPGVGGDGQPTVEIVRDLPASERFFAGGDTTVRGFSLDRLGTEDTISPVTGFPTGGNAMIVLNAELRIALIGALRAVTFVDAGNVFPRAAAFDIFDLRPAAGVGLWYQSPIGPIRLDLGFNLRPRELVPGTRERRYVLHLGLGPAF